MAELLAVVLLFLAVGAVPPDVGWRRSSMSRRVSSPALLLSILKGGLLLWMAILLDISSDKWTLCLLWAIAGHLLVRWLRFRQPLMEFCLLGFMAPLLTGETLALLLLALTLWITFGGAFLLCLMSLMPFIPLAGGAGGVISPVLAAEWAALLLLTGFLARESLMADCERVRAALKDHLVRRKLYRYLGLIFPCIVFPAWGSAALRWSLWTCALLSWGVEIIRFRMPRLNEILKRAFRPVGRSEEGTGISGTSYYLLGAALAASLPPEFGVPALVMLTLGDAWASLCGRRWGRHLWFRRKSVEGSAACFAISLSGGYSISMMVFDVSPSLHVLLVGAAAATLAEVLFHRADNLFIAPVAGVAMWGATLLLH